MTDEKFNLIESKNVPSLDHLIQHFKNNFRYVNGRLVPNVPRPIIVDYINLYHARP